MHHIVGDGYFRVLRIPLIAGRAFGPAGQSHVAARGYHQREHCKAGDHNRPGKCAAIDQVHSGLSALEINNNPVPMTTRPIVLAILSPRGARRSAVIAVVTAIIARRSMTPTTR